MISQGNNDLEESQEIELNAVVREYLEYANYQNTLETFDKETLKRGRSADNKKSSSGAFSFTRDSVAMEAFKNGQRDLFISEFYSLIPDESKSNDPEFTRLEFLAQVYFALYPTFGLSGGFTLIESMRNFQQFLASLPPQIYNTTQFLRYYALPYIPDPRAHPSFREIYEGDWIQELEGRISSYINDPSLREKKMVPMLIRALSGKSIGSRSYQNLAALASPSSAELDLQREIDELRTRESEMAERQKLMSKDHHSLIGIASELVAALANSVNGCQVSSEYLLDICDRFAEFKRRADKHYVLSSKSSPQRTAALPPRPSPKKNTEDQPSGLKNLDPDLLDYESLSRDLANPHKFMKVVRCLIAGLDHLRGIEDKRHFIQNLTDFDVLQLSSNELVAIELFFSDPKNHQDVLVFIDKLVKHHVGRDYMLSNDISSDRLLTLIIRTMATQVTDSPVLQYSISVLQTLSVRRHAQSIMNRKGLIDELHNILESHEQLSEYTITFTLSLFMNLCLRSLGRRATIAHPDATLTLMVSLMKYDHSEIRMYINGILFNLFTEPEIKKEALEMEMKEVLYRLRNIVEPSLMGQIDLLLDTLDEDANESENDVISEDGDEEDFDFDDDQEHSETESYHVESESLNYLQSLCGYALKEKLVPQAPKRLSLSVNSSVASFKGFRPTTPLSRPHTPSAKSLSRIPKELPQDDLGEFSSAFGTRSKIPRTPLGTSMADASKDLRMARSALDVRQSVSNSRRK